jgi:ribonuclease P protein component
MRRASEFVAVTRTGRRAGGPLLVATLAEGVDESPDAAARVGVVVSKRVGTAVTRNAVRRRLRHLVRARLHRLPAGSGLVLRAHPSAAARSSTELAAGLDRALDRLLGAGR